MKVSKYGAVNVMSLSRRNLEALLTKLDGVPSGSNCTIMGGTDAQGWLVTAEENDVHYAERPAGGMHPETEAAIAALHRTETQYEPSVEDVAAWFAEGEEE